MYNLQQFTVEINNLQLFTVIFHFEKKKKYSVLLFSGVAIEKVIENKTNALFQRDVTVLSDDPIMNYFLALLNLLYK